MPTPVEVIAAYNALLGRARAIVEEIKDPYDDISEDFMMLSIDGEKATLSWLHEGYENSSFEVSKSFEARLLTLSDNEFNEWQQAEQALKKAEKEKRERDSEAERRERELRSLAYLKSKYEGGVEGD